MALTVDTFEDLVHIVETHPEWRRRLKRALFDFDIEASTRALEKAVAELVSVQARVWPAIERLLAEQSKQSADIAVLKTDVAVLKTDVAVLKTDVAVLKTDVAVLKTDVAVLKTDVAVLKTDVAVLKTDVAVLKTDVAVLKTDVAVLKTDVAVLKTDVAETKQRVTRMGRDVADLKGKSYEHDYLLKAKAIFGRFIRRGRDRTDDMADLMHDAVAAGQISEKELTQVLAADLLWGGKTRQDDKEVVLVLEASWRAEVTDVERAQQRAATLRRIGVYAVAVVAGSEWDEQALSLANSLAVVTAANGTVDGDSWRKAAQMEM